MLWTLLSILPLVPVAPLVPAASYANRVEIRRTSYGVPHILAEDLAALGYGMAWVQLEDFGFRVVANLLRGRGELARHFGHDSIESDVHFRQTHRFAVERFHLLERDTRDLFTGWAAQIDDSMSGYGHLVPRQTSAGQIFSSSDPDRVRRVVR